MRCSLVTVNTVASHAQGFLRYYSQIDQSLSKFNKIGLEHHGPKPANVLEVAKEILRIFEL